MKVFRFAIVLFLISAGAYALAVWSYRQQTFPYTAIKAFMQSTGMTSRRAASPEVRTQRDLAELRGLGYV
jgi:hypothetical protein